MAEPQIQYCTTADGVSIAYAVSGSGPPLLFLRAGFRSHLAVEWQHARIRRRYEWLAMRHTLVRFDPRGSGLSQRNGFELNAMLDIEAVTAELGLHQFSIFALAAAAVNAITYAAAHPEQVTRMLLWNGNLIAAAPSLAGLNQLQDWTTLSETLASAVGGWEDPAEERADAALIRASITKEMYLRRFAAREGADVAPLLRRIIAPTLVVHIRESLVPLAAVRTIVAGIPNARLQSVEGKSDFIPFDAPNVAPWLEAFLAGEEAMPSVEAPAAPPASAPSAPSDISVVLFTDIVDSTALTERLGDTVFRTASRALDEGMRAAMREAGGEPVEGKVLGDGVMGVFKTASQAIVAARRCIELSAESELQLHVGLHAGDVLHEAGNVYGGAVNIASRVCGLSAPGEVLVSATVRELARTSAGVTFADRGKHALKGIDDAVRLYEVRWRKDGA
jgi:class 3 adenylate cyclase